MFARPAYYLLVTYSHILRMVTLLQKFLEFLPG